MIRSRRRQRAPWRRAALAMTALAVVTGTMVAASTVPASAATGWVAQTPPNPAGTTFAALDAVSCSSATNCIAVGNQDPTDTESTALAEHWNGSTWALQTAVNPAGDTSVFLSGVSCPTATFCMAVGVNQPSVGSSTGVAESWNGSTWTLHAPVSPADAWLSAISCTSSANCEAVGTDSTGTLAEHWNGSTWTTQTSPTPDGLTAVSCLSASFCEATNDSEQAANWNGSTWSLQTTTSDYLLFAVSCATTTSCEATGYESGDSGGAVAEHWNGTTWTNQIAYGTAAVLWAVSCAASATTCVSAGTESNPNGDGRTIATGEYWNGSTWAQQAVALPSGVLSDNFQAISCPTTTFCIGVGDYESTAGDTRNFAGEWT